MPAAKPTQPPASDFGAMENAWLESVRKPNGDPYLVFDRDTLTTWKRWVGGEFEYDGKGLRDVVNSNAIFADNLKDDIDGHKAADLARHQTINNRLAALEAAVQSPPFPG